MSPHTASATQKAPSVSANSDRVYAIVSVAKAKVHAASTAPRREAPMVCARAAEALRARVRAFARTYNHSWLLERHGYRTPVEAHQHLISQALVT